jgi:hypothetical protein
LLKAERALFVCFFCSLLIIKRRLSFVFDLFYLLADLDLVGQASSTATTVRRTALSILARMLMILFAVGIVTLPPDDTTILQR